MADDKYMPLPYERISDLHLKLNNTTFSKRKDYIMDAVKRNTVKYDKEFIDEVFDMVHPGKYDSQSIETHKKIKRWFLKHTDKISFVFDGSYLAVKIVFEEQYGKISIWSYKDVIPENDTKYKEYLSVMCNDTITDENIISKLDWLYENCEFIPAQIFHEDFEDEESHKFSHIKSDSGYKLFLKEYLDGLQYKPNDDVYYYIKYSHRHGFYLKRDYDRCPKQQVDEKPNK